MVSGEFSPQDATEAGAPADGSQQLSGAEAPAATQQGQQTAPADIESPTDFTTPQATNQKQASSKKGFFGGLFN